MSMQINPQMKPIFRRCFGSNNIRYIIAARYWLVKYRPQSAPANHAEHSNYMKEFQERAKTRRKKRSKLVLLLMLAIFVLLVKGAFSAYAKESESRVEVERSLREKEALDRRYQVMSEQSDELKSDVGIESEIRNKFDVAKPGEGVIVIVDKDAPILEEDNRGVLKRFWDSVKGVFSPGSAASSSAGISSARVPAGTSASSGSSSAAGR